jgi:hypothetical protein
MRIRMSKVYKKEEFDLADIFRLNQHKLQYTSDDKRRVINAITACRTSILGGHVLKCDNCDHLEISYNSCRNRHCPQCQSLAKALWVLKRDRELLPVHYFHLVFTVPHVLNTIALSNKKVFYNLLFKAVSESIKQVAKRPENLGAEVGFFTILHTWDQVLNLHPHIHCVIPGGGFSCDRQEFIKSPKNFFVSVKKLSKVFRGKLLNYLEKAYSKGIIIWENEIVSYKAILKKSCTHDWVVYAKPPFNGPFWVLRYLSRYTHRIAISNNRLFALTENTVTFSYRDRNNGYAVKYKTLGITEFMLRYLNHVLPFRFMKIRYYGFLGNPGRKENIDKAKILLGQKPTTPEKLPANWIELMIYLTDSDPTLCKKCGQGHMVLYKTLARENINSKLKAG